MNSINKFSIPIAIVLAGVLIAGAVYLTRGGAAAPSVATNGTNTAPKAITVKPLTSADHIMGDPNADLVLVEYTDLECPFCKAFHQTMLDVMSEYGKTGKVAWVIRNFPLAQLHPKAPHEAEAAECAGDLGGKSVYWDYVDKIFSITPSNNGLDPALLLTTATGLGIDGKKFQACLDSGKYTSAITQSYNDAIAAGADGTPYSIIITKKGDKLPLEGAQPLESVKAVIDGLLKAS